MEETPEIKLTAKQERFCYEYCIDFNGTQAAIRAGYSEQTARAIASENLSKLYIQNRIKQLQDNLAETAGVSKMRVLQEHMKLAFSSIAHLHNTWIERKEFEALTEEQKSCIAEISTQTRTVKIGDDPVDVEFVKIKLYDKQKALDSISKMLGFDAPIRTEIKDTTPVINLVKGKP